MKKVLSLLVPVMVFLVLTRLGTNMLATGTVNPMSLLIIFGMGIALVFGLRPKSKGAQPGSDLETKVRGEFAKDAFADSPELEAKFRAAMNDLNSSMPKSALNKLIKLQPLCKEDKDIYAVSLATAHCQILVGKPVLAVREYKRALSIHATPEIAIDLGSCHQRLGDLDRARDSYEFALDLDEGNLDARSRIATTYVADHDFETALEYANKILDLEENHVSALATAAICHGVLNDPVMHKYYTKLAVENGYSQKKIEETVSTLKKRA